MKGASKIRAMVPIKGVFLFLNAAAFRGIKLSTFQLYLKNNYQHSTKRTDPQIAFANLGVTLTLKDYNENKFLRGGGGSKEECVKNIFLSGGVGG